MMFQRHMKCDVVPLLLLILSGALAAASQTPVEDVPVRVLDSPEFVMSPAAVAAGLDGKLPIALSIGSDGRASDVRVYGTPMWPCGSRRPESEIDEVLKSVKRHVSGLKFSPEIKNGKAKSVSAEIVLALTDRFKGAANAPQRLFQPDPQTPGLIDVVRVERFGEKLQKPALATSRGVIEIQVLVDETGKVVLAGLYKGSITLLPDARDAACGSTFRPATVKGKAYPMTGLLMYYVR